MAQRTEEEQLMHRLRHKFHKTAAEYELIAEGDRILVAVSGGKDSLALLELMAARVHVLKPRFSIVAAHVVMTNIPYQSDTEYLATFARNFPEERKRFSWGAMCDKLLEVYKMARG